MRRMIGRETLVNAGARARRAARCYAPLLGSAAVLAAPLGAQARLTRTDEAAPVPAGVARLRVIPSWSRFDRSFAGPSAEGPATVPLASALTADSLGVAAIPGLAATEDALRALTGDVAFRLSLGRSVSRATARVVTTAFAAEYGLTRRLTIAAVLPIVQTQTELFVALNPENHAAANVGPNPGRIQGAARMPAVTLQTQLGAVRTTLQNLVVECDQNAASDPRCPSILANRSDVQRLLAETSAFGSALATLFGTSSSSATQPFVALAGTGAAAAIASHLSQIRDRLRGYVGDSADQITAAVPVAVGPAAFGNIQHLLLGGDFGLSPDSLGQVYRLNFGDIELGAKLLVHESGSWAAEAGAPAARLRARVSLVGIVRFGTGSPTLERLPHRYLEYGTGDGQTDLEAGALMDVGFGSRFLITGGARYTVQLGEVDAGRIPDRDGLITPFTPLHDGTRRLGDILVAEITPRYLLGRFFAADVHYALVVRSDDEYSSDGTEGPVRRGGFTEQRAGVGITYSTLQGTQGRMPRLPFELSIARIETIAGSSALVPRASRNQIELRLYYRVRRSGAR